MYQCKWDLDTISLLYKYVLVQVEPGHKVLAVQVYISVILVQVGPGHKLLSVQVCISVSGTRIQVPF